MEILNFLSKLLVIIILYGLSAVAFGLWVGLVISICLKIIEKQGE